MTDSDWLDAIEARLAAATPGPWTAVTTGVRGGDHWYVCDRDQSVAAIHANDGEDEDQRQPDAEFIAHAPADIARLVSALREAQAKVERVEALAADFDGGQYNIFCRLIRAALADPKETE